MGVFSMASRNGGLLFLIALLLVTMGHFVLSVDRENSLYVRAGEREVGDQVLSTIDSIHTSSSMSDVIDVNRFVDNELIPDRGDQDEDQDQDEDEEKEEEEEDDDMVRSSGRRLTPLDLSPENINDEFDDGSLYGNPLTGFMHATSVDDDDDGEGGSLFGDSLTGFMHAPRDDVLSSPFMTSQPTPAPYGDGDDDGDDHFELKPKFKRLTKPKKVSVRNTPTAKPTRFPTASPTKKPTRVPTTKRILTTLSQAATLVEPLLVQQQNVPADAALRKFAPRPLGLAKSAGHRGPSQTDPRPRG